MRHRVSAVLRALGHAITANEKSRIAGVSRRRSRRCAGERPRPREAPGRASSADTPCRPPALRGGKKNRPQQRTPPARPGPLGARAAQRGGAARSRQVLCRAEKRYSFPLHGVIARLRPRPRGRAFAVGRRVSRVPLLRSVTRPDAIATAPSHAGPPYLRAFSAARGNTPKSADPSSANPKRQLPGDLRTPIEARAAPAPRAGRGRPSRAFAVTRRRYQSSPTRSRWLFRWLAEPRLRANCLTSSEGPRRPIFSRFSDAPHCSKRKADVRSCAADP